MLQPTPEELRKSNDVNYIELNKKHLGPQGSTVTLRNNSAIPKHDNYDILKSKGSSRFGDNKNDQPYNVKIDTRPLKTSGLRKADLTVNDLYHTSLSNLPTVKRTLEHH